jgi:hypothetical protein
MQCNIDSRGKVARLITGCLTLMIGVAVTVAAAMSWIIGWWIWLLGVLLLAFGAFQIFEAWAGWCVVRAMGFKTRM